MNHFDQCLAESHASHDLPLWREIYEQAFDDMLAMHCHRKDGDFQRAGVDRSIVLECGKVLYVDEKIRKRNRNGKVYTDIALEYLSNDRTNSPGWVVKPLMCDFIAYAIAPLGRGYLLPVQQLQRVWRRNGEEWIANARSGRKGFSHISAPNPGYSTLSVGVEPEILFPKIGSELRISFTPMELSD